MSFVQDLHRPQVLPAALKREGDQFVLRRVRLRQGGESTDQERVAGRIGPAEPPGMMQISGHPLESVKQQFLGIRHLFSELFAAGRECVLSGKLFESGHIRRQLARDGGGDPAGGFRHLFRIEIHIGDGCEKAVGQQRRVCPFRGSLLQQPEKQVLKSRAIGLFPADAALCAAGAERRLFTLKTEHFVHCHISFLPGKTG